MRTFLFFLLFFVLGTFSSMAQVNQYDTPAEVTFKNTYVPPNYMLLYLLSTSTGKQPHRINDDSNFKYYNKKSSFDYSGNEYGYYMEKAYEALLVKNLTYFIAYSKAVLSSGIKYRNLYYNMGIAYYLQGKRSKSKKYLKKAKILGHLSADIALDALKKKSIDYSYFEIDSRYIK